MPAVAKKKESKTETKREIVYPEIEVKLLHGEKAITMETAKQLLGWISETDWAIASQKEAEVKGGANGEVYKFATSKNAPKFQLKDENGELVGCVSNDHNRPFDRTWAMSLAQDVLNKRYRLNGETMIFDEYGITKSGQHRLIAEIFACQIWEKNPKKFKLWAEMPTIESVVVVGIPADAETTMTLDNVKPRTIGDVVYTSDHFSGMGSIEREECARMVGVALDFLWKRLDLIPKSKEGLGGKRAYQTHSTSLDFLDRHKRIEACIKHLFTENAKPKRAISSLGLSPGMMSAVCYLMASSKTESGYHHMANPSEKKMDFSLMDRAQDFFVELVGTPEMKPVREKIGSLVSDPETLGGRSEEKLTIIEIAWQLYLKKKYATTADLKLEYSTNRNGIKQLVTPNSFGGIDLGWKPKEEQKRAEDEKVDDDEPKESEVSEIEAAKEEMSKVPGKKRGEKKKPEETPVQEPAAV